MKVDYELAASALKLHGGVPRFPSVTVTLGEADADGVAEMTIEGDFHATEEDVARALGLPVDVVQIKRTTASTVGYVVSEPNRPPSPGAIASRGRVRPREAKPKADKNVVSANATAGRTKTRRK